MALALLSAFLLLLAQPPFHFVLLSFSALVPLGVALGSLDQDERTGRPAAWIGVAFGAVYWGVLLVWVPLVVAPLFPWAFPGYVVQVGLLSGLAGMMAWATHRLHRRAELPLPLSLSLAWVGMEYLKGHFPFGLSFPWLGLGISLTGQPELLGLAEWTGEGGVAFWLAMVNGLLAAALLRVRSAPQEKVGRLSPLRLVALAVVVALLPALAGIVRDRTLPLELGPRVAVVGTGVPAALRRRSVEGSRAALAQVEAQMEGLAPGEVDLVVLPEATISIPLDGPRGEEFRGALAELARRVEATLLVGALGEEPVANSAFLLGPDGSILSRYDKTRLVPGMEGGGYRRGPPGQILEADGVTLAPLICYESLFGGVARSQRRAGATLMVNLTSDVWFGGGGVGRLFLDQHPAHLVMRAVETRMGVARAANGGFSFLLDPGGRLISPPVAPGAGMARGTIPLMRGGSLFSRTGDLVGPLALLLVLLLLGWPLLRERKQSVSSA